MREASEPYAPKVMLLHTHARLQVHRDDAMANPRLPGHVAERRRRVVPPSALLALQDNTVISPALLSLSRKDLLAASLK
jgi:hypothetical protein